MDFLSSQKHTVLMANWGPDVVSLGDGGVRHHLPANRWQRGTWLQRWRNGWRWLDTKVTSRPIVRLFLICGLSHNTLFTAGAVGLGKITAVADWWCYVFASAGCPLPEQHVLWGHIKLPTTNGTAEYDSSYSYS